MVKIALLVSYHPDETAPSLLSRLAAANRVQSVTEFSRLVRLDHRKIGRGDEGELRRLFDLAGFDTERAPASQPKMLPSSRREFDFGVLPSMRLAMSGVRFCPFCLKADIESGADKPNLAPYRRLSWLLSSFRTCPEHGLPLTQVPALAVREADFLGTVRPYLPKLCELAAIQVARACDFEAYLDRRMRTGTGGAILPDALGMHGLMTASEAIGQVIEYGPTVRHKTLTEGAQARAANAGFNLLQQGEDALDKFLMKLEPPREGARKASIHRAWGRFYTVVSQYRGDDLEPVKAVLRNAILRRYPKKAGSVVLDKRVSSRRVHTMESAAKATGIAPRTLRRLFQNEPSLVALDTDINQAGSITDENLAEALEVVSRMMTGKAVIARLGTSRIQFERLVRLGIIGKMPGLDKYFDKSSVDRLMAALEGSAIPTTSAPVGTWSLVEAIASGLSTGRAIDFVIQNRLDQIWCVESEIGLRRIWLDETESKKKLHPTSPS